MSSLLSLMPPKPILMKAKSSNRRSKSRNSTTTPALDGKETQAFFSSTAEHPPFFLQRQRQNAPTWFPTLGVYPVIENEQITRVRVDLMETNDQQLDVSFFRISDANKAHILSDENFSRFIDSAKIITVGTQLFYQYEHIEGTVTKVPVANPNSNV